VTLIPYSVLGTAMFLIAITTRIGAHFHTVPARLGAILVMLVLAVLALVAFGVAVCLFLFTKPQRLVPPRYRNPEPGRRGADRSQSRE
jgi:hypothetical protein